MKIRYIFLVILSLVFVGFPSEEHWEVGDLVKAYGVIPGRILKIYGDSVKIQAQLGEETYLISDCEYAGPRKVVPAKKPPLIDDSLLLSLGIFGTFTGIIPALAIILAISLIIGLVKSGKKAKHMVVHPEEYRKIGDAEKRKELLTALRDDHENYL
jgi:hypothetical protein